MTLWRWFKPHNKLLTIIFVGGVFFASPVVFSETPLVMISEFVALNDSGLTDEDGDHSDWIELVNWGEDPVSLAGWSLSDKAEAPRKWVFPAVIIEPNAYLLIFASGKNRVDPAALHTNFQLDRDGEVLGLYAPDGALVSMPGGSDGYPEQLSDFGYAFDGGKNRYVFTPNTTAGDLNDLREWYFGRLDAPIFSHDRGLFTEDFLLDITASQKNVRIVYSLDGSFPTSQDGIPFDNALTVSITSIFRAVATAEHWLSSHATTQTYLFPGQVERQEAPGYFPVNWGGYPADYTLDPTITEGVTYTDRFVPALEALPTLSLVFDARDFFNSETGIYVNTLKEGQDWERPVSVGWLDGEAAGFSVDAGIRIQGRSSRQARTTPKHSFRLLFKRGHGPDQLEYPLFGEEAAQAFDTLVLRATSNHSWLFPVAEQRERAQYLRDPWVKETFRAMGHTAPRTRFIHLYLNGLYWGLYNVSERPDDQFMASYFGGTKSNYDVFKGGDTVAGNPRAWRHLFAVAESKLNADEKFNALDELIDMDGFIDFIILNHFIGNETWDFGNWYGARNRTENGKFHFFVWDGETSMDRVWENRTFTRNNLRPTALFQTLRMLPAFQQQFAQRLEIHCTGNGALTPESTVARYKTLAKEIDLAIVAESARWGDYRLNADVPGTGPYERYTRDEHWLTEQQRLLTDYFPQRTEILLKQYVAMGLWPLE